MSALISVGIIICKGVSVRGSNRKCALCKLESGQDTWNEQEAPVTVVADVAVAGVVGAVVTVAVVVHSLLLELAALS